jgi:hypothetical protein
LTVPYDNLSVPVASDDTCPPSIAITAAPTTSVFGQEVALTVSVTAGGVTPTGTVLLKDGSTILCGARLALDQALVLQPLQHRPHLGAADREQLGQAALAVGGHMQDADRGGTEVRRQGRQQVDQRVDAAGRSADADDKLRLGDRFTIFIC